MKLEVRNFSTENQEQPVEMWLETFSDGSVVLKCRKGDYYCTTNSLLRFYTDGRICRYPSISERYGFSLTDSTKKLVIE